MKRPYLNRNRSHILCPVCKYYFFNRRYKKCPHCKTGLKFRGEYIYEGDWYWSEKQGWIIFDH